MKNIMEKNNNILLFEDFTKLYGRWKNGNVRKENEFNSNINDLKEVELGSDFPVLFADKDLTVDGNNVFTFYEVYNIIDKIEETGWRLPTYKEIQKLFYGGNQPPKPKKNLTQVWEPEQYGSITSIETNETLVFETNKKYSESYWCGVDEKYDNSINSKNERGFEVGNPKSYYDCLIRTNNFAKTDRCKVRLIKNK